MLDFLFALFISIACAYLAHECVRVGNVHYKELSMSPNWSAVIAFIFGIPGIVGLLFYGAIKVMVKRMFKH